MIFFVDNLVFIFMGRPRKYTLNEDFFNIINTNDKAYILGFIYADGSIYKNYLSIKLAKKDQEILEYIKLNIDYNGVIREYNVNSKKYVDLTICSKKIVNDLIKHGILYNKTYLSENLPLVEEKYIKSLLLGIFDGDGSIYRNIRNGGLYEYTVNFSNNKSVLNHIKKILLKWNISSSNIRRRYDNDFSCMLDIRGNLNIEKIKDLLYNESNFYLKRKKNRFNDFTSSLNLLKRRYLSEIVVNNIKNHYLNDLKQIEISKIEKIPYSTVRTVIQRLRKNGKIK